VSFSLKRETQSLDVSAFFNMNLIVIVFCLSHLRANSSRNVTIGDKMSSEQQHHEDMVNGFHKQLKQIFDESEQAIYLYLDDNHKVCNKNFASLLGYSSPEEWAKTENPLEENVDKRSQDAVVSAYYDATDKMLGCQIDVKLKTTSGRVSDASVIVVPVAYMNHMFALYFISKKAAKIMG
jgi:PAS domain-containing protein